MKTFARTISKGAIVAGIGTICVCSGVVAMPVIGAALLSSGAYSGIKATIRGAREIKLE